MFGITVTHRLSKGTKRFLKELLSPPVPPQQQIGELIVFKVKADNPDLGYHVSAGNVTDSEGNQITDPAVLGSLVRTIVSSDPAVVEIIPTDDSNGTVHFGAPGVASVEIAVKTSDGTVLGSGSFGFTVVTGDPAAVSDIGFAVDGLIDEPPTS